MEKCTGVIANGVALEACVQAQNEGWDLGCEVNEIILEISRWSPISCCLRSMEVNIKKKKLINYHSITPGFITTK